MGQQSTIKDAGMDLVSKRITDLPTYIEAPEEAASQPQNATLAACASDQVFAQALRDNSNRELDWLWVYVQVKTNEQRRYCLERALAINPNSTVALRELEPLRASQHIKD